MFKNSFIATKLTVNINMVIWPKTGARNTILSVVMDGNAS